MTSKAKKPAPPKNKKPATKPATTPAAAALPAAPVSIKPGQLRTEAAARLKVGDRVRATSGQFQGKTGTVEAIDADGYCAVHCVAHGAIASIKFDAYKLEKV